MRNQWILSCFVEPKVTGVISPVTICVCVCVCVCTRACAHTQLSLTLCNPMDCGENTRVGCYFQ